MTHDHLVVYATADYGVQEVLAAPSGEGVNRLTGFLPVVVVLVVVVFSGSLAARLESLRGARIGVLDNHKEFADLVLAGVVEALRRDYGVEIIRFWRKDYLGIPSPFPDEMAAQCDAVVNGVGH